MNNIATYKPIKFNVNYKFINVCIIFYAINISARYLLVIAQPQCTKFPSYRARLLPTAGIVKLK